MDGYCIAGEQPVFPGRSSAALAGSLDDVISAFRREKAARDERLAAQRDELVAQARVMNTTVPTLEQRRDALLSQLYVAERELQSHDNAQTWGRWTADQFAELCAPARARAAEARMLLLELAS